MLNSVEKRILTILTSKQGLKLETRKVQEFWNRSPCIVEAWFEILSNYFGLYEGQNYFTKEHMQPLFDKGYVKLSTMVSDTLAITETGWRELRKARSHKGNKTSTHEDSLEVRKFDRNVKGRRNARHD